MGSESYPRTIANLIFENPNETKKTITEETSPSNDPNKRKQHNWKYEYTFDFEELEDQEILGNIGYHGKMIIGADYTEGEPHTMYLPNGDPGHPGTAGEWEWEIIDITDISGYTIENGNNIDVHITEELKEKLIDTLNKHEDDINIQELLNDEAEYNHYPEEQADMAYDEYKDEGY